MIENMIMEISEHFIVGINKKISIMLKSVKAKMSFWGYIGPTLKTVLLYQYLFKECKLEVEKMKINEDISM